MATQMHCEYFIPIGLTGLVVWPPGPDAGAVGPRDAGEGPLGGAAPSRHSLWAGPPPPSPWSRVSDRASEHNFNIIIIFFKFK